MGLPVLRALRSGIPAGSRILVFVKSSIAVRIIQLARLGEETEVQILWPGRMVQIALAVRRRKPQLFLTPQATPGWKMPILARIINAERRIGPQSRWSFLGYTETVSPAGTPHKVEYYLRFVRAAGLAVPSRPDLSIAVSEDLKEKAAVLLGASWTKQTVVVFAPGSGHVEAHKRWPAAHFVTLGRMLLEHCPNVRLVLFGGFEESELLESISAGIGAGVDLCKVLKEGIIEMGFAVLSSASCLVSACSGAAHMAAAVGLPVVGLYGPSNPGFTGPYDNYFRVVRLGLPCSPCHRVGFIEGCGDPICMKQVEPQQVFNAVLKTLHGEPYPPVPWLPTTQATRPADPMATNVTNPF